MPAEKRILLVDDHPILRRGLAALIELEPDFVVCAEAASCADAIEAISDYSPDLVIVDLELEESHGLDLVKDLKGRYPDVPALVLSMHPEEVYAERSLRAGARGYVSKQDLDEKILEAIRRVFEGETYMSDELEARLAAKFLDGRTLATDSPLEGLSDRELQVFRMIGQGRGTREVAEALHLSIKTIESHREHIKQKLTIETAAELAQRATQWVESGRAR